MYTTKEKGFTIVELLIVIVVIAILAAISIVAFTGVQQRGRDSNRTSDASNIAKALTAYTSEGNEWPADAAAAQTALTDTSASVNVSSEVAGKVESASNTPTNNTDNDDYGYVTCDDGAGGPVTGARITYQKENLASGETNPIEVIAGRCS
ncbi:MAG: type II secretion system protein [Candidatus Saccharimonadales bacterium]